VHQRQSHALYLLDHDREDNLLHLLVFGKKHQSGAILAALGYRNALQQYELVRNLQQDSGTVARLSVCSFGTAMPQVLQGSQRTVYQLMTFVTMNVDHHAHATSVVFIPVVVQSFCHISSHFVIIKPVYLAICLQNYLFIFKLKDNRGFIPLLFSIV